jgi:hypothetical protein
MAAEEYCLCLLLSNPALRERARALECDHFETTENRSVFEAWQQEQDIERLRSSLDDPLAEHLDFLLSRPFPLVFPTMKKPSNVHSMSASSAARTPGTTSPVHDGDCAGTGATGTGLEAELATLDQAGLTSNEEFAPHLSAERPQRERQARLIHGDDSRRQFVGNPG